MIQYHTFTEENYQFSPITKINNAKKLLTYHPQKLIPSKISLPTN